MRDATLSRRPGFRLLPDDSYIGWTPYVWLGYFPILLIQPVLAHARLGTWLLTVAAGVVFLALYFRAYWAKARELKVIIVAIATLGFAFMPSNAGASVFLTYAASFAGILQPRRSALVMLGALGVAIAAVGSLTGVPTLWIFFQLFLAAMVGLVNVHFSRVRAMSSALQLARAEVENLARVAERERIARDLHDVLGHTLTLITLKSALAARLAERDPARAADEMRDIENVSRGALQEVRAAVSGYRDVGLAREIESAESMLAAAGIALDREIAAMRFAPKEETALALAVREAVTNVVRHAGATWCRITLRAEDDARLLAIEDNGRGKRAPDGNGLTGMGERVRALGGHLRIESRSESGTSVQIRLAPLPQ